MQYSETGAKCAHPDWHRQPSKSDSLTVLSQYFYAQHRIAPGWDKVAHSLALTDMKYPGELRCP